MAEPGTFAVHTDELDLLVGDLVDCEQALEALTGDVERHVAGLHGVWSGVAADAQREAQQEWATGMAAMRQALAVLRAAARTAHESYTAAAAANRSSWEQVR